MLIVANKKFIEQIPGWQGPSSAALQTGQLRRLRILAKSLNNKIDYHTNATWSSLLGHYGNINLSKSTISCSPVSTLVI
jgi:hypothetical protein